MLRILTLALFSALLFTTCDEIAPTLNPDMGGPGGGPGPVDEQPKQVLIEEFTGVRCVNCPAGSEAIERLLSIHGHRLVAVSIHAGFFARPYPESNEDLSTSEGETIQNLLDAPLGYPTAVVNRVKFDAEESRQTGQGNWAGYIQQELVGEPSVRIDLQPTYNSDNRSVNLTVDLYPVENINEDDIRLSVYLIENSVEDSQLTPNGQQDDYIHKHVFRDAITATDGEIISETLAANGLVSRNYSFTLADRFDASKCHVVAFVHLGGNDLQVLQAHEVAIFE